MASSTTDSITELRKAFLDAWSRCSQVNQRLLVALALLLLPPTLIFLNSILFGNSKRRLQAPLPPGPRGLPLLGSLPFLDPELHSYLADLSRKYGPIMKLQLGQKLAVVISSPSTARQVLKDHDIIFANRDVPVAGLAASYGGSDIVWRPYGPEWRMLRKVCVLKMLSNTTLNSVYSFRRKEMRSTVKFLWSRAGSTVDIGSQLFLNVMNVITTMLWGDTVHGEERDILGAEFRQAVAEMTLLLGIPNLSDFFPAIRRWDVQRVERKLGVLRTKFDTIFESIIQQRLKMDNQESQSGATDFLQILLKMKDEEEGFTITHLKALLMDMIVGGTDTSSNTTEFAMAEVINKPEIMAKAQKELDSVVGKDSIVEESHIPKLQYLYAIMKETLRLHPALPLLVPHCPSESVTVGGYTVPEGSRIFVNVWAIHRDPCIWENPLEFDPERFLGSNKYDYSGNDFSYFPFGSGRRICAGTAMAERMVMFSLATLLHSFNWKLPKGLNELDLDEKFGIVLKKKSSLAVVPTPRLANLQLYHE
uniref:Cytochrome P450 n=1 Tax=Kalanchoe fedtschenkoi TaxID=63787 RepID=A0A7N0VAD7_KALFE